VNGYLPFLVIGIATGSIYAIAAMGLVLTYKTSGIFNFGHGAVGAAAAFLFYTLHVQFGLPWPVAAAGAVLGFGVVAGLLLELLGRGLAGVTTSSKIVGTLGLLLAVQGLAVVLYGPTARSLPPYLPDGSFKVGSVFVGQDQLIAAVLALLTAAGVYVFFRVTRTGTAMRAVVDDAELLSMMGTPPATVRRTAWVMGAVFASLSGVLIAPVIGLDATLLTLLVVQAFGAAAVGRFTSVPLAYAGGLALGVLQQLVGKWVGSNQTLASLPVAVPFLLLFAVLLATPSRNLPDYAKAVRSRVAVAPSPALAVRVGHGALATALLLAVPLFAGTRTIVWATALVYVGVLLSLGLLVRLSGQVSLCQVGFMAVGAASFGHLDPHLPWLAALVLAGLAAVPFGALVAIPAMRLSGLYLALATFGFGLLLEQVLYRTRLLFGGSAGVLAHRPGLASSDRAYYYLVLTVIAALVGLIVGVERARLGRLLRALSDSPTALSTHGAATGITRLLVFCLSAFVAGISGALYVPLFGAVNGDAFRSFTSLLLLAVLAVAGTSSVRPAFVGAGMFFVAPSYISSTALTQALPAMFGISAVAVALASGRPRGTLVTRLAELSSWRLSSSPLRSRTATVALLPREIA
jgi:branched-subunit amino acid ABC-type transport system permease component